MRIAQAFVRRYELAPADELAVARVTRLRAGLADREGTTAEERVIDVGVVLRRVIDGLPADGPGGHIMVYIGADGEVTGADRIWRPIAGVHSEVESLRPREWLEERISRHFGADRAARLDIHEVRLGYFEDGWNSAQEFLQPAYIVLGILRSPDERLRRRSAIAVPAATTDVGEIMPPGRQSAPGPVRRGRRPAIRVPGLDDPEPAQRPAGTRSRPARAPDRRPPFLRGRAIALRVPPANLAALLELHPAG